MYRVLLLLLCSLPAFGQTIEKVPEVEIERPLVEDEEGLLQFEAWPEIKCPTCKARGKYTCFGCDGIEDMDHCPECEGEKKANCRQCDGARHIHDPLHQLMCMSCRGSGWTRCGQCMGGGVIIENRQDGTSNTINCLGCKKKGFYECAVCEGEQHIETIRVKKKAPWEAKLKDLKKTQEAVNTAMEFLEGWEPQGRASKVMKQFEKDMKTAFRDVPKLKDFYEVMDAVLDNVHKAGAGYVNYESKLELRMLTYRQRMVHYLRYQARVLELCVERAEHNEAKKAALWW